MKWLPLILITILPIGYVLGFQFVSTQLNICAVWAWSLSPALLVGALLKKPNLLALSISLPFCWLCATFGEIPFRSNPAPLEGSKLEYGKWSRKTYPAGDYVVHTREHTKEERIVFPGIKQSRDCQDSSR